MTICTSAWCKTVEVKLNYATTAFLYLPSCNNYFLGQKRAAAISWPISSLSAYIVAVTPACLRPFAAWPTTFWTNRLETNQSIE